MITYQLEGQLDQLRQLLTGKDRLSYLLSRCNSVDKSFKDDLAGLLVINRKGSGETFTELKEVLDNISLDFKNISSRQVFAESEAFINQVQMFVRGEAPENPFNIIINGFDEFISAYEYFLREATPYNTARLIREGGRLTDLILIVKGLAYWVSSKLEPEAAAKPGYEELSVLLPYATDYDEVVAKLADLGGIHAELCNLLGVSTSEYKLEIRKIESGSLWISVIGNALIIGFIISLIKSAIGFIHRNYTNEGKIAFIPRELEAADNILQFTKKAQEAGLDVTASRENVQKALFNISSKLNDLVADQPTLEVNGEVHSVTQAQDERYLRESKRLLLEDGKQDEQ